MSKDVFDSFSHLFNKMQTDKHYLELPLDLVEPGNQHSIVAATMGVDVVGDALYSELRNGDYISVDVKVPHSLISATMNALFMHIVAATQLRIKHSVDEARTALRYRERHITAQCGEWIVVTKRDNFLWLHNVDFSQNGFACLSLKDVYLVSVEPKPQSKSLLQDWVMELPLREQGTLMTSMRCCDVAPKLPDCINERYGCSTGEGSTERHLHAFLRYCCINPADQREVNVPGAWFQTNPPMDWKPSQFGHYPLHWFSHLMHCFEVVGYRHPNESLAFAAKQIYFRMVRSLHLSPESAEEMIARLSEDRIENGTVVS